MPCRVTFRHKHIPAAFIADLQIPGVKEEEIFGKECIRKNAGNILMYGDDFAKKYFDSAFQKPLFSQVFQRFNA